MSAPRIRFYFDEKMPDEAATQLRQHGIDDVTTQEMLRRGTGDMSQLQFAIDRGRVLCTYDKHFVDLAKLGMEHPGIAYFRGRLGNISRIVRALRHIHEHETVGSMKYRVEYL